MKLCGLYQTTKQLLNTWVTSGLNRRQRSQGGRQKKVWNGLWIWFVFLFFVLSLSSKDSQRLCTVSLPSSYSPTCSFPQLSKKLCSSSLVLGALANATHQALCMQESTTTGPPLEGNQIITSTWPRCRKALWVTGWGGIEKTKGKGAQDLSSASDTDLLTDLGKSSMPLFPYLL